MPFTPFHFGPAIFFGLLFSRYLHLPTFIVANIIIDLEPIAVLLFGLDFPLHGVLHSFLGGFFAAVILAIFMAAIDKQVQKAMKKLELAQPFSAPQILFSSVAGVFLHVVLDSTLYTDIRPFFPLEINPFFVGTNEFSLFVYVLCSLLFLLGVAFFVLMKVFYVKKP